MSNLPPKYQLPWPKWKRLADNPKIVRILRYLADDRQCQVCYFESGDEVVFWFIALDHQESFHIRNDEQAIYDYANEYAEQHGGWKS
jgi:hypothetical protein